MRREVERAVKGYEAREGFSALAVAIGRLIVRASRWAWRTTVVVVNALRLRWSIRIASFAYVSGPMRLGDEHPSRKGWFYTGKRSRKGVLLWYRPPGHLSRWVRRGGAIGYCAFMAIAIVVACLAGGRH